RLDRLQPPLALALEHLELLVLAPRTLELLLRRPQARQDQPQRVAPRGIPLLHRGRQRLLEPGDQAHRGRPLTSPPSRCQCRWKTVWPAPAPQKIISRYSSRSTDLAVSATKSSIRFASSSGSSPMSRKVSM